MTGNTHNSVQDYYGKVLQKSDDLKTNACCTAIEIPRYIKNALSKIQDEVLAKYYGCGLTIPYVLDNRSVLDLGCGAGRDVYLLSQLVGENGKVVGVDMTDEQISVAKKHQDYHVEKFGYQKSNVDFKQGYIEKLNEIDLKDDEFDVIVSNCVINLSPDKEAVLKEAYRVLKEGGELYFSDVYADRRVEQKHQEDPVLFGECLSGALYWNDFLNLAKKAGFLDPRVIESAPITIENEEIQDRIGHINFYSVTYRLFKLPELESDCEDYGQAVIYKGGIKNSEQYFDLDDHHRFYKGKVTSVCGNTYLMLNKTRFEKYFEFIGTFEKHYGIFEGCGGAAPFNTETGEGSTGPACC